MLSNKRGCLRRTNVGLDKLKDLKCHVPTKHAQMGARISSANIFGKLRCLKLGRHNDLREISQVVQIDTSLSIKALYDTDLLS